MQYFIRRKGGLQTLPRYRHVGGCIYYLFCIRHVMLNNILTVSTGRRVQTSQNRGQVWHVKSCDPLPGNDPTDIWVHRKFSGLY